MGQHAHQRFCRSAYGALQMFMIMIETELLPLLLSSSHYYYININNVHTFSSATETEALAVTRRATKKVKFSEDIWRCQ